MRWLIDAVVAIWIALKSWLDFISTWMRRAFDHIVVLIGIAIGIAVSTFLSLIAGINRVLAYMGEVRDDVLSIDTDASSVGSSALDWLEFSNAIVPLDVLFALIVLAAAVRVGLAAYKLIKSWLPV